MDRTTFQLPKDIERSAHSLWVMGGCMSGGFGLADGRPFWERFALDLGLSISDVDVVQPVSLGQCLATVRSLPMQPAGSVLLLQLGNYDCTKLARSPRKATATATGSGRLGRIIDAVRTGIGRRSRDGNPDTPANGMAGVAGWHYPVQVAIGYAGVLLDVFRDRAVLRMRMADMGRTLDEILAAATLAGFTRIIVLSTFPTARARANRHRRIGRTLLRDAARKANAEWVDVWHAFPRRWLWGNPVPRALLGDIIHLNDAGHELVENVLCRAVANKMLA